MFTPSDFDHELHDPSLARFLLALSVGGEMIGGTGLRIASRYSGFFDGGLGQHMDGLSAGLFSCKHALQLLAQYLENPAKALGQFSPPAESLHRTVEEFDSMSDTTHLAQFDPTQFTR